MNKYINVESFLEKVRKKKYIKEHWSEPSVAFTIRTLVGMMVMDQEDEDVVPVVHGQWMDAHYAESTEYGSNEFYTCSVCNEDTECGADYEYCPHCGARMNEKED